MSTKNKLKPVEGKDFTRLKNDCMVVSRQIPDLIEDYKKEAIPDYLGAVDHSITIKKPDYEERIIRQERELNLTVRKLKDLNKSLVVVFQGRDSAGKSGATERIIEALDYDMSIFQAVHVGPPTDEEKAHPFLWRFGIHQRVPEYGQARVFDRSWYERVLVEPVMGFVKGEQFRQSYAQIRAYEWLMVTSGQIVVKFWLDITKEEQKARFEQRAKKKPWKVTEFDGIARSHWDDYTEAANEMLYRTGTDYAPWFVLSSEDKKYSRVAVLEVINHALHGIAGK